MTVTEVNGNSFQGKGDRSDPGRCPGFVFIGNINGNRIRPEVTFVNIPDGAMGHCRSPGHFDLEMLIGENGIPHLIGSYKFTWGGSGTVELTKAR